MQQCVAATTGTGRGKFSRPCCSIHTRSSAVLPVTLAGYFLLGRTSQTWAAAWLAAASLFFYGWWDYR